MVDHNLLLEKLGNYGFERNAILLMRNYFENRVQRTKINSFISNSNKLELGVPQGSCLGPLLFSIFINDLPNRLNCMTTLFADDTTLNFDSESLDSTIELCKDGLKQLTEWCQHNKLLINWTKTNAMFVSTKRFKRPNSIKLNDVEIEVVDEFKLLGVLIDSKLTFIKYTNQLCNSIFKKLYMIKRLFYLAHDVKLQFFKSFILPYFDYCFTLSIYFHKTALDKLCKTYYQCLFKLFKFKFINKSNDEINTELKEYNLFSFTHRLGFRLVTFVHKLVHDNLSPSLLRLWLQSEILFNSNYNLRSNNTNQFRTANSKTKYGDIKFNFIIPKILNKINFINLSLDFRSFKNCILNNLNFYIDKLITIVPKFNNCCNLNYIFN